MWMAWELLYRPRDVSTAGAAAGTWRVTMRILLVKPPLNANLFAPVRSEPLELEYLASAAEDHAVQILDMRIDRKLQDRLRKFRPHLVGVTSYTCDVPAALEVLREVKKFDSRIVTAVGGNHATFLPVDFAEPSVNAIFLGMGDISFRDFVNGLESGKDGSDVHNLALVRDGRLEFTPAEPFDLDLDRIPFPARHLTADYWGSYRDLTGQRTAMVLSSRGCPFRCTFCSCWKVMKGRYLTRSPDSIVREMASLPEDVANIQFADDNTLHSVPRARRLCQLIREKNIRTKLSMYARADLIVHHPDLMRELKEAGLAYLTVGVESFREEELLNLNKRTSVEMNNEAIRILRRLQIGNSAHFIVSPDYDEHDFRELYRYVCASELYIPVFAVLTPLPGTDLYERTRDRLAITDYSCFDFVHSVLPTRLSRKDFYRQFARLYLRTYSFRRYFQSLLKDLLSRRKRSGELPPGRVDRLSFLALCIVHIVGLPLAFKVRRIHRSEPLTTRK
jgi:radical SAM superfamily enzyme YgiQ (UPF0313 family)